MDTFASFAEQKCWNHDYRKTTDNNLLKLHGLLLLTETTNLSLLQRIFV